MQALAGDPGRNWRRMARWGALACTLATLIPFERAMPLWGAVGEIFNVAMGDVRRVGRPSDWLVMAFCCMAVPVFLAPPGYLWFCTVTATRSSAQERKCDLLLILLWGITALTPYIAVFRQLPDRTPATETPIAIAISMLSAYLLLCGLSFLASRRARYSPLFIFSMGTLPVGILFFAWTCFMLLVVQEMVVGRWTRKSSGWPTLDISIGFVGSLLLLIGWLKWWGAVRKACAPQPVIDSSPQIAGAIDASTVR